MTPHELSDADITRMSTPLWEQAKASLAEGDTDRASELIDRAVTQWSGLKDYSINWITTLLTFIGEELGEAATRHGDRVGDVAGRGAREGDRPGDARQHG
jgi:hypothetical protein